MLSRKLRTAVVGKPTGNLLGVAFGGGQWVVVGAAGAIWTSTNAIKWTRRTSGTTNDILDVNYTGSIFFACGTAGLILTSTDGITWTNRSVAISEGFQRCSVANNVFFITGGSATVARLYSSTNGTTWTSRTLPTGMRRTLFDVIYYNNGTIARYYVIGTQINSNPAYGYSTNLSTWTSANSGTLTGNGFGLFTNGSVVVMSNRSPVPSPEYTRFGSSTNGTTFTLRYTGTDATEVSARGIWTGTKFLATSNIGGLFSSSDGTSWSRTSIASVALRGIRKQGSEILVVGDNGTIGISYDDGVNWSFL